MMPDTPSDSAHEPTDRERPSAKVAILRGMRGYCPRCGEFRMYRKFHLLHESCAVCDCQFLRREGNCWGLLYVTMGGIIGLAVLAMLLIQPPSVLIGQLVVVPSVLGLVLWTLPARKGLALAIDILVDPDLEHEGR